MQTTSSNTSGYQSLEDIRLRKEQLSAELQADKDTIGEHWHRLVTPQKTETKGELIAALISNGITAFDAFLLFRKLMKGYRTIFGKKKRR